MILEEETVSTVETGLYGGQTPVTQTPLISIFTVPKLEELILAVMAYQNRRERVHVQLENSSWMEKGGWDISQVW